MLAVPCEQCGTDVDARYLNDVGIGTYRGTPVYHRVRPSRAPPPPRDYGDIDDRT